MIRMHNRSGVINAFTGSYRVEYWSPPNLPYHKSRYNHTSWTTTSVYCFVNRRLATRPS